jgi:AAA15 family ATPase/GTPase
MFKQVTLENFRTHKLTTIELYPVTLLIGNNNSGKTNLLAGIQYLGDLVRRGNSNIQTSRTLIISRDLSPHKYRLAKDDEPISFSILWNNQLAEVNYKIEIYKHDILCDEAGCKEKIIIKLANQIPKELYSGYDNVTDTLELRQKIQLNSSLEETEKSICESFFNNIERAFICHFQPAFIKKQDNLNVYQQKNNKSA